MSGPLQKADGPRKKKSFWDVSFLGHAPYRRSPKNPALQQLQKSSKSASTTPHYDPAEADLEHFCNSWSAGFLGERLYAQRLRSSWWLQPLVQDNNGLDPDGASCGNSDLCVCFLNKRCSMLRGESPTARGPATAFLGRSRKMTWQQRAPPHSPASNEIEAAMRSDPYFLSSAVRAFDFTC